MVRSDNPFAISVLEHHHYGGDYYEEYEIVKCPECGWYKPSVLYYSHKKDCYVGCQRCIDEIEQD